MTRSLENRLRHLEAVSWGAPCPECGFGGDYSKLKAEVSVSRLGEGWKRGPDNCPECGRVLVIRVPGLKKRPTWKPAEGRSE